ncbi:MULTISPECIES: triphosphoribosyl-dephospho-CoA synthase CitG, partial [Dickeya]
MAGLTVAEALTGGVNEPGGLPDIHQRVVAALTHEVQLTPKPGLVDGANSGSHRDMDMGTFEASIAALSPWFARFTAAGWQHRHLPLAQLLARVRPVGLAAEQAMHAATGGVNTHKGGIFAFGLVCSAAGWLAGRGERLSRASLCASVAQMSAGLVETELAGGALAVTAGERLYRELGLTGARGEAASGFATVRRYSLPAYLAARARGVAEREALLHTLVVLMAHNRDTNVVSRGGLAGLSLVQRLAREQLSAGVTVAGLEAMDRILIAQNLSPGGSADLLALTWLLAGYPAL